ncbi:MAG: carbohydrate ABC transporter permease [Candidatus Zhuqueibacterota bacterium]
MNRNNVTAYFFLAPALTTLLVFFFIPVLAAFVMSFTDFDIYSLGNIKQMRFVLVDNFKQLFHDPIFWKALKNTLIFVLIGAPLTIALSLFAAIGLNSRLLHFKTLFRLALFLPVVTTLVAVAVVWRYLYHPYFGLINYVTVSLGFKTIDWLGDPNYALIAIVFLAVWKNFGYYMMIFLAGLQSAPDYLYEAAEIDGAGWWRQFQHVTIPHLAPTTLFVSLMTVIGYLQFFAEPFVMTQGGPLNSTLSVVLYLYQQGFRWWRMGYASTIAFVLFFIVFFTALVQLYVQKRKDGNER